MTAAQVAGGPADRSGMLPATTTSPDEPLLDAAMARLRARPEHEVVQGLLAEPRQRSVVEALLRSGTLGLEGLAATVEHGVGTGDEELLVAAAPRIAELDPGSAAQLLDLLGRLRTHRAVGALAQSLLDATRTDVPRPSQLASPPRVVITGTGRCGTGFTASVLQALGLDAGHEHAYTVDPGRRRDGLAVDVSWLAAARLEGHRGPVVHQVRDPMAVVRSLVGIRMFSDPVHGAYRWFMLANVPGLGTDDLGAAVRWYVAWNERIEQHTSLRVRLEDLDADGVTGLLNEVGLPTDPGRVRETVAHVGGAVNSRPRAEGLGWADLPDDRATASLRRMGRRYGYAVD